jgi:transaldolase
VSATIEVEMHADSRREAFTPDRIRLLSAAFRKQMHWSEVIGRDVVISPPYKWQVLFNASDLRVMPLANRLPCKLD